MVTLLQASLVFLMLVFGLGLQTPHLHLINLLLTMAVASWAFLAMLFAMLRVFGEASKLLAVLLLTLQLAAGGGVIPVELSGGLFQTVHDWLPLTWVVKAFRASMFGAYDHGWADAWGAVILAGGVALLLAALIGRWKVVPDAEYRSGTEF
jgi:putative membrane protein